jgi:hypothetical protein
MTIYAAISGAYRRSDALPLSLLGVCPPRSRLRAAAREDPAVSQPAYTPGGDTRERSPDQYDPGRRGTTAERSRSSPSALFTPDA